jgi:hypothetical protein
MLELRKYRRERISFKPQFAQGCSPDDKVSLRQGLLALLGHGYRLAFGAAT